MKAITICQPYAHLIVIGEKPIENRTWPTSYRGEIAIHAGKSRDWLDPGDEQRYPGMPFGAVVAVATLTQCRRVTQLAPSLRDNEHANGPWCWVLENVRPLSEPVPYRGAQGLWLLPSDVAERVRSRADATQKVGA